MVVSSLKNAILMECFKHPAELLAFKRYSAQAENFLINKKRQLADELYTFYKNTQPNKMYDVIKSYSDEIGFPELRSDITQVNKLYKLIEDKGGRKVIDYLVNKGFNTKLADMLVMPALLAIDGMKIDRKVGETIAYSVGLLYPVSSDMADSVLDGDFPKHPEIPDDLWVTAYSMGAASLLEIARHPHLDSIDERVRQRADRGIQRVAYAEKLDVEAKTSKTTPIEIIEKIYQGKIEEIERTVFECINIPANYSGEPLIDGSGYLAHKMQIGDDFQDLLGHNEENLISVANPSYFLTYCRQSWNKKNREINNLGEELENVIKEANINTRTKAREYHIRLEGEFEKLEQEKVSTKPLFGPIVRGTEKYIDDLYKNFASGITFPQIKKELRRLLLSE